MTAVLGSSPQRGLAAFRLDCVGWDCIMGVVGMRFDGRIIAMGFAIMNSFIELTLEQARGSTT